MACVWQAVEVSGQHVTVHDFASGAFTKLALVSAGTLVLAAVVLSLPAGRRVRPRRGIAADDASGADPASTSQNVD